MSSGGVRPDDAPARRVARLVDSGLFDAEFYAALRGRSFVDEQEAARDYVGWGMPRELPPNPFLDFAFMPKPVRRAWRQGRLPVLLAHLSSPAGRAQPCGPLFDPAVEGAGPLRDYLTGASAGDELPVPTGLGACRRPRADEARGFLLTLAAELAAEEEQAEASPKRAADVAQRDHVDWPQVRARFPARVPDRTTVVIPTVSDWRMTLRAVRSVLDGSDDLDVEVVVVDNGSPPRFGLTLAAAFLAMERVRYVRLPHSLSFAAGCNVGFAAGTGDLAVFLRHDSYARAGWLTPLRTALDDPEVAGAQPLLLGPDDMIRSAGIGWPETSPVSIDLLAGHPPEDAAGLAGKRLRAITGTAMAVRAVDVAHLAGFDPHYSDGLEGVDLCLRIRGLRPGGFRVLPASVVTHFKSPNPSPSHGDHAEEDRERVAQRWTREFPDPDPDPFSRLGRRKDRSHGELRWSINLPSTAGHWGDSWGDTYLAAALGRALRSLGQEVVTRRRDAHQSGPTHLDDVALGIRGRYPLSPSPGRINVLWIISHPEDVDPVEFEGYDLVCAASTMWSAELSARTGREVVPLLQATEFQRPVDVRATSGPEASVVFVGTNLGERERPLVWQAVEAGIPLSVYGPGWDRLPEGVWRGARVPNPQLPELYRRHGIVLADHWTDMAQQGFIANRVFDAVACGAVVISDDVVGLHDVFDPRDVVVARTPQEIRDAVDQFRARPAPARDLPAGLSFDARAAAMVDLVLRL